jgi:hypothetical protein
MLNKKRSRALNQGAAKPRIKDPNVSRKDAKKKSSLKLAPWREKPPLENRPWLR